MGSGVATAAPDVFISAGWSPNALPIYHISAVSGVLGKAAMKVREEMEASHWQFASPCSQLHDFEEGRPSRAGRPVCARVMRRAVYDPSMHCYLEIVRRA